MQKFINNCLIYFNKGRDEDMEKKEKKIAYLLILLFALFITFYIIIFTFLPFLYLLITAAVVLIFLTVGTYIYYKKKNQFLPYVVVRFLWDFIKISSSSKPTSKKEPSPPLTGYEKNGIIYELAKGKCEHLDCTTEDNLELYYIVPRSRGGENTYDNMVALCPTHYEMAEKGVISKGALKYFINERDKIEPKK